MSQLRAMESDLTTGLVGFVHHIPSDIFFRNFWHCCTEIPERHRPP